VYFSGTRASGVLGGQHFAIDFGGLIRSLAGHTNLRIFHCKTEVPDPLVVEDLISYKLNNRRKLARLITQYTDVVSNISEDTAFHLQDFTENNCCLKR